MASLQAIREALATTISDGVESTLFCYSDVADVVELPCVLVEPSSADFLTAMVRGSDTWMFNVYVLCNKNNSVLSQDQLDGFVSGSGPDSIRQVIFNNPDLGLGDGTDATVVKMAGYGGTFSDASISLVGAILKVSIVTDGRA